MTMLEIKKSKWYKVRLNTKSKTFAIMPTEYNLKSDVSIKSNQYQALNFQGLQKLISQGFAEFVEVKKDEWIPQDLTGNAEVERQIEAYARRKANAQALLNFFTPVKNENERTKPFDYSKEWENYYKKRQRQLEREGIEV